MGKSKVSPECQRDEEIDPWSVRHLSSQVSGSRGTSGLLLA